MFSYLQSTRVERPAMQTSRQRKDFAQILLLVKWISNTVCGWRAQTHVPIHSCDSTSGYFQEQEIGRILLYHIPKGEATSEAILASRLSIYGAMGARADVMNPVSQQFSTGKEEHGAKDNSERVQSIAHDARCCLKQEASTSKVHQERSNSRFLAWIARQTRSDL